MVRKARETTNKMIIGCGCGCGCGFGFGFGQPFESWIQPIHEFKPRAWNIFVFIPPGENNKKTFFFVVDIPGT